MKKFLFETATPSQSWRSDPEAVRWGHRAGVFRSPWTVGLHSGNCSVSPWSCILRTSDRAAADLASYYSSQTQFLSYLGLRRQLCDGKRFENIVTEYSGQRVRTAVCWSLGSRVRNFTSFRFPCRSACLGWSLASSSEAGRAYLEERGCRGEGASEFACLAGLE